MNLLMGQLREIKHHSIVVKKVGAGTAWTELGAGVRHDLQKIRCFEQQCDQWQLRTFDFKIVVVDKGWYFSWISRFFL